VSEVVDVKQKSAFFRFQLSCGKATEQIYKFEKIPLEDKTSKVSAALSLLDITQF